MVCSLFFRGEICGRSGRGSTGDDSSSYTCRSLEAGSDAGSVVQCNSAGRGQGQADSDLLHIFFLLGTIDKNAAICCTIGGHIQTQYILSFQMVPVPGSHLLALMRYEEKLNRALMKFQLKITFLTKFSQNIVVKCPFFDRKKDFWQK